MGILIRHTPSGWNTWHNMDMTRGDVIVPFATFPPKYLPARGFWSQSFSTHCYWPCPWSSIGSDPFSSFLTSGGASGSLVGSLAGLAAAADVFTEPTNVSYGIGMKFPGAELGFCIGDIYKEYTYIHTSIGRTSGLGIDILNYETEIDVFQRAKLRRLYLHHGIIERYEVVGNKHILTLDIDQSVPDGIENLSSYNLRLTIHRGKTEENPTGEFEVNIAEVLDNFQFVIKEPDKDDDGNFIGVPQNGDFYTLSIPLTLKDPYLMTGTWLGTENEGQIKASYATSGYNLHGTSKNVPFQEIIFTGAYVLKKIEEPNDVVVGGAGSSMYDAGDLEWVWVRGANYDLSSIYRKEEKRWKETVSLVTKEIEDGSETTTETYLTKERTTGTDEDVKTWLNNGATFLRLEIDYGGEPDRSNFHAPILTREWFIQSGHYFAILGQPEGNIIDISLRDVTDTYDLDYKGGGEIFNQYSWFISEHYMSEKGLGIFGGTASVSSYGGNSKVTIECNGETYGTILSNSRTYNPKGLDGANSFYNRFTKDTAPDGGTIKAWEKYDDWKLTSDSISTYAISYIDIPERDARSNAPYIINLEVDGDASKLDGNTVWIIFDTPYRRIVPSLLKPMYSGEFEQGADEAGTATICGDTGIFNSPIDITIPFNTTVGLCGGRYWGSVPRLKVISNDYAPLIISTPSSGQGITAFYSKIAQEDWVIYKDAYTNRLTVRTGQLGFRERPRKIEISVGKPMAIEESPTFPVTLNTKYNRVKMLTMSVPKADGGSRANTFQIGGVNDYHGFIINGGGTIDFQALRYSGIKPGATAIETFKFKDYYVSPVYLYQINDHSMTERKTLPIGMSTEDGPIYVKNGNPTDIKIEYVHNSQTLEDIGYISAHQIIDGEHIVVYSQTVNGFSIDDKNASPGTNKLNNTENAENGIWEYPHAVFIIGTADNGHLWGCPVAKSFILRPDDGEKEREKYQWPLMVLNNVNFQFSLYDKFTNTLHIISKHFDNGQEYLADLSIPMNTMIYQTELCENEGEEISAKFLWRPPALEKDIKWTDDKNLPTVLTDGTYPLSDRLVRIMGHKETKSKVIQDISDIGTLSGIIADDGVLRLVYDSALGVRMLFSRTTSSYWQKSAVIIAKNANSGFFLNESVFAYITVLGIQIKIFNSNHFNNAYLAFEGKNDKFVESVQKLFDTAPTITIGSGQINPQRLAGYQDVTGIYYVFYYDNEGQLAALRSKDLFVWEAAPNF